MTVCHHLDDATLLRYASGDLDEAFCVVVAAHLAGCDECRQAVRTAEEIGGHLLETAGSETPASGAFDRVMDRLRQSEEVSDRAAADDGAIALPGASAKRAAGDVPVPLRRFVGASLEGIAWKAVAPGVRRHPIPLTSTGSSLYMLHIAPGKAVPEHGHGGAEMTLILKGAYRDALGRFGPGDIADLDEHVEHQPVVEPGEPCICLVATESPTRFRGLFSRLMQPLVGI